MDCLKFAVIGHPIGHTMSPFIHTKLFEIAGIKGEYTSADIPPEKLGQEYDSLRRLRGINVTIPHKAAIISFLDEIDRFAAVCGAVNTVKFSDGFAKGYNTDRLGFLKALQGIGITPHGNVIICGCGGAASMAAFVCAEFGCNVTIAARARSLKKAQSLAEKVKKEFPSCKVVAEETEKISGEFDILCNATPAGMYPNVNSCPVPDELTASCGAVFDCVYNPGETLLLKKAREMNIPAASGMAMLVWQAAAAQEIWHGFKFESEDINRLCLLAEKETERIFR